MRIDKPIGTFLLWFPTAWVLWVANNGSPPLKLLFVFLFGTFVMRSAGCVINDIADRDIDKHVMRTKSRPLTSRQLSLKQALVLLMLLFMIAFSLLLLLPSRCFYYALFSLAITMVYPFCKRFINAPQAVLGIAFSMGMPMAAIASGVEFSAKLYSLMIINFLWVLSYDTIYAMADKPDDLLIGVKSTAIYFADYDRHVVGLLQSSVHFIWLLWAKLTQQPLLFYVCWLFAGGIFVYQQIMISGRDRQKCHKAFLFNCYYGAMMWLALIFA